MNYAIHPYRIFPLGDSALTVEWEGGIDEALNREVLARFAWLQQHPFPGIIEASPAYNSLALFYDVSTVKKYAPAGTTAYDWVKDQVQKGLSEAAIPVAESPRTIKVPVCYEHPFAPDLPALAAANNLTAEEVISIHCSIVYRVYMLGFLPGFTYMGQTDERIAMKRKEQPMPVMAGSIGIAGRQTGIYPLASPGGWHIIGRSPLKLFDKTRPDPILIRAGDHVQFFSISRYEFENY